VSKRDEPETVGDRIEAIRRTTPPPAGRKSRLGYISKEDFADLVGCGRSRIFAWTRTQWPQYPEERFRERLADLSRGRYQPDDFASPDDSAVRRAEQRLEPRVAALEEQMERLERHILGSAGAQER
jgi:hypothetical protein